MGLSHERAGQGVPAGTSQEDNAMEVTDYSESLIRISELRKSAQQALLAKRHQDAIMYADQIFAQAYAVRQYCIQQMEKEHGAN